MSRRRLGPWAPAAARVIGLALLAGCTPLRQPSDVALHLGQDVYTGDLTSGTHLSSLSVYTVIASASLGYTRFQGCGQDIGGGVRCTFVAGCGAADAPVLTMHLQAVDDRTYHVTAAAITGLFRTADDPDYGTLVFAIRCARPGVSQELPDSELGPYLASELYSTALVPWPYAGVPTDHGDTTLAMSRLATNRGATDTALADLQQALVSGEDTTSVVTTAVVEAAFTLGLHVTSPYRIDPTQNTVRPVWNHDAEAYPSDSTQLRRGIALLDFAMDVPHPGVDWDKVAVLGRRGRDITFTHTPSIAAMEEMNGIAHYVLARSLMTAATQVGSCERWAGVHDALATGYADLVKVPRADEADRVDADMIKAIGPMAEQADSARRRVCRARA